jgi:hypothetical protein
MSDKLDEILGNQLRFMDDIERMSADLDRLRHTQESAGGGWMAKLTDAGKQLDDNRKSLDLMGAAVNRLVGAVETLTAAVFAQQPG